MLQGEVVEQVRARYQAIVDHHVALTVRSQDVLVLEAFGFEAPEIARSLVAETPSPVYNKISSDFDYMSEADYSWYYPHYPYVDEYAKARVTAAVYPAGGANFASNNIYGACR